MQVQVISEREQAHGESLLDHPETCVETYRLPSALKGEKHEPHEGHTVPSDDGRSREATLSDDKDQKVDHHVWGVGADSAESGGLDMRARRAARLQTIRS